MITIITDKELSNLDLFFNISDEKENLLEFIAIDLTKELLENKLEETQILFPYTNTSCVKKFYLLSSFLDYNFELNCQSFINFIIDDLFTTKNEKLVKVIFYYFTTVLGEYGEKMIDSVLRDEGCVNLTLLKTLKINLENL